MSSIITLTTDFGQKDHYVSVMKAVMLRIHPDVRFIDTSHEIPPQDVMAGAWVVRNSAMLFPPGTVHLVVVDPGVGTPRKPVGIQIRDQYFIGPDNGIFSLIAEDFEHQSFHLTNDAYWLNKRSATFHGRDIFAPAAAHLAKGVPIDKLGEPLEQLVTYRWALPIADKDGVQGWVVHIDRYGNLITNIPQKMLKDLGDGPSVRIYVGNTILKEIVTTFGDVPDGEPAAYIGSSDNLEVAINKGDAQQMLGVEKGAQVSIVVQK